MKDEEAELARIRGGLRQWDEGDVEVALSEFQRRREAPARLDASLEQVRAALRRWSPEDVDAGLGELRFRLAESRRVQRRGGFLAVALFAAAALVLALVTFRGGFAGSAPFEVQRTAARDPALTQKPAPANIDANAGQRRIALDDGSEVTLIGRESSAQLLESKPNRVVVTVSVGHASFRVMHRPERVFAVQVGGVLIEDLGTVFDVVRGAHEVSVQVVEGTVRVTSRGQVELLEAGEGGRYPLADNEPEEAPKLAPRDAGLAKAAPAHAPDGNGVGAWRSAAREGRYGPAFQLLQAEGFGSVRDEPNDLLLAADVARLSGHPSDAITPLRNLIRSHRSDPRSPAAAFTLGSVLLRDLNRPREAALAFLEVKRLAPSGNLAEDAEARATEAWYRASERDRAQASLERYRERYPSGRHLAFLNRLLKTPR